jgi:hypothetical protein
VATFDKLPELVPRNISNPLSLLDLSDHFSWICVLDDTMLAESELGAEGTENKVRSSSEKLQHHQYPFCSLCPPSPGGENNKNDSGGRTLQETGELTKDGATTNLNIFSAKTMQSMHRSRWSLQQEKMKDRAENG